MIFHWVISPELSVENWKDAAVVLPCVSVFTPSVKVKETGVIGASTKFAASGDTRSSDPWMLSAVV
jgi:hypothetical protein